MRGLFKMTRLKGGALRLLQGGYAGERDGRRGVVKAQINYTRRPAGT